MITLFYVGLTDVILRPSLSGTTLNWRSCLQFRRRRRQRALFPPNPTSASQRPNDVLYVDRLRKTRSGPITRAVPLPAGRGKKTNTYLNILQSIFNIYSIFNKSVHADIFLSFLTTQMFICWNKLLFQCLSQPNGTFEFQQTHLCDINIFLRL